MTILNKNALVSLGFVVSVIISPLVFGKVIVLSWVGSSTVNVVSKLSVVAPSNIIAPLPTPKPVWVPVKSCTFSVGLVKVLFVKVWLPVKVATVLSIAKVTVLLEPEVSIQVQPVS